MEEPMLITFQGDKETKRKLVEISKASMRNMSSMLRWLINREYEAHVRITDQGREALADEREQEAISESG